MCINAKGKGKSRIWSGNGTIRKKFPLQKRGWETTDRIKEINLSRLMGKPTICIGENKGADQLRGNREADQRLCFRYSDSTIPPLLNSKISSF